MDIENAQTEIAKVKKPIHKKWWFWAIAVVLLIIIASAAGGGDKVKKDLLNYRNNELATIEALEAEVSDGYENARQNYTDDFTLYQTLKEDIIPKSQELIEKAEQITPETKEVKELHEEFISALNTQHNAFTMILSALENQDYAQVTQANEKLDEARKHKRSFTSDLQDLAQKHGLVIKD